MGRRLALSTSLLALLVGPAGCTLLGPRPTPVPGVFLMVPGGYSLSSGEGWLGPLYTIPGPPDPTSPPPRDTTIRLYDAAGRVLGSYSYRFTPCVTHYDDDPLLGSGTNTDRCSFCVGVPWFASARRVVVYSGKRQAASVSASPHTPSVRVLYPNGGEVLAGLEVTVRWEASDEDGDIREFAVACSTDDGQTWETMGFPLADETALQLDLRYIPASDRCRVRVCVTDGFDSSWDVSDGPFTIQK